MTEPAYQPFPAFAAWADAPLDRDTLDRYFAILDRLQASSDTAALARAVETATRAAAIDTGAIEGLYEVDRGFTMTVAIRGAAWEAVVAAREPVVRESFRDALHAYDYVLDLATTRTEVSEKAIREIHAQICASQETYSVVTSIGVQKRPLPKGEYKETPNNPTSLRTGREHAYAPPIDVPSEMHRLVAELRSEAFTEAHPVLQAAYAHYAFVAIHPFADGNGRVSRAVASVYLYRNPGIPLVVFADQKDAYLDALEDADDGNPTRFVRFVQERVIDMIGLVELSSAVTGPPVLTSVDSLREHFAGFPPSRSQDVDAVESRLLSALADELTTQVSALELPEHVKVTALAEPRRSITVINVQAAHGPELISTIQLRRGDDSLVLTISLPTAATQALDVSLRDVVPALSAVLRLKLRLWCEETLRILLAEFADMTRADPN